MRDVSEVKRRSIILRQLQYSKAVLFARPPVSAFTGDDAQRPSCAVTSID